MRTVTESDTTMERPENDEPEGTTEQEKKSSGKGEVLILGAAMASGISLLRLLEGDSRHIMLVGVW